MEEWEKIYNEESEYIYRFIYGMVYNQDDANEVLQETFYRAIKHGKKGVKNMRAYLIRIARNIIYDMWRKRKQEEERMREREESASDVDLRMDIEKAIKGLIPEYREVFVLKEINGLNYDEIAALLKIPIGTVKSRLNRARIELREKLRRKLEM
jgi:RNA polymerase sigma-70 factor (ECF subfamily)|uniref:RNA polymerase sigma factor n=1 Tax=candidate division WOR-3 bacterium TaxID=2052148 RepID=A0A7C4UG94_UNCW3